MRNRDDNKKEAILEHALKMIVQYGFDGLSMQKLARAAGVSPATIYIYYKDRDDLLLQLFQVHMTNYFGCIMQGFDPDMDFATGLKTQWRNRANFVMKHPDVAHFMEHFSYTPLHYEAVKKIKANAMGDVISRFVKKAIRNKQLVEMPIEVYWSVAFAPLYNLLRWNKTGNNMAGEKFKLTDDMMDQTLALVLKALKP
jgi:AcrR family transcriptional regulator